MSELADLAKKWRDYYEQRIELEHLAEEFKDKEKELKGQIMEQMAFLGHDAVKLSDGGGTISKTRRETVSMSDHELACRHMYERMKAAENNNKPLINELITTKTVSQSLALEWARNELAKRGVANDFNTMSSILAEVGMRYMIREDLSYRKS
jgi:hypothetical protein